MKTRGPVETRFPTRTFSLAVAAVCLLIATSSIYTWRLLGQLHRQYLHSRGDDVAGAIDLGVRGPGRRPNPQEWERAFRDSLEIYGNSVLFMALVDREGSLLAFAGPGPAPRQAEFERWRRRDDIELYEKEVGSPGRGLLSHGMAGWRLVLGLRLEPASFILRVAWFHLLAAALGIASLIGLAAYFVKASQQLLALKSREDAQRRLASLGRLSATLAHEIRNPLAAIKGLSQIVQETLPKEDGNREHLEAVVEETERLEKLVEDLLMFARPREPKMSRFDLAEEIAAVAQIMGPELSVRGVELEIQTGNDESACLWDRDGLHQILLNVLRNAMEASPAGSRITVSLSRLGHDHKIVINDQGPGLSEDAAVLFEPFKTTKVRGTGLGLSVSKQIVESLGGSVRLENRPGGGVRCTISLLAL